MSRTALPVICLMGPTAAGKTAVAVELVQALPCSIISVDSALVYRGMDIGTAKPTAAILQRAPHRLLDICDPATSYSAGQFRTDAARDITAIHAAGRIPLLVGGTMLYFRALQSGLAAELPTANADIRQQLQAEAAAYGTAALHARLQALDPIAAARIHANDPQRVQRALEVHAITGKSLSHWLATQATAEVSPYQFINITLAPHDRAVLHRTIATRFEEMLAAGFIAEVTALRRRSDLHADLPAMRAVGYRQAWDYLDGKFDLATLSTLVTTATRQLAKRQLTWLRRWPELTWFDSAKPNVIDALLKHLATILA